jgi:hypothetical protein
MNIVWSFHLVKKKEKKEIKTWKGFDDVFFRCLTVKTSSWEMSLQDLNKIEWTICLFAFFLVSPPNTPRLISLGLPLGSLLVSPGLPTFLLCL